METTRMYSLGLLFALMCSVGLVGQSNPGILYVDGVHYSTIPAALQACSAPACVIDARGDGLAGATTIGSILQPSMPTVIYLGCYVYTGPASGSLLQISNVAANGSAIIGCGMTSNDQPSGGLGTRLMASSSNSSDVADIGYGVQGIRIENLTIDGNNIAKHALTIEGIRNSVFSNLNFENTVGVAINAIVSTSAADQGNQLNLFQHIRSYNVNGLLLATSSTNKLSDFTHNTLVDIESSVNQNIAPGMELMGADTNHLYDVTFFNQAGGTTCVMTSGTVFPSIQLDHVTATQLGALNNYFYGVHLDPYCPMWVQGTTSGTGGTGPSAGTQIYGYDRIENQQPPTFGSDAGAFWIDSNGTIQTPGSALFINSVNIENGTLILPSAGSSGRAACFKSDKSVGYCSSVVRSNGSCTCN